MVASAEDHLGGAPKVIDGQELIAWNTFLATFQLQDSHAKRDGELFYTWDNMWIPNPDSNTVQLPPSGRILRRLDRFHVSEQISQTLNAVSTKALDPQFGSDHLPVHCHIRATNQPARKKSIFRWNVQQLKDVRLQIQIREAWLKVNEKFAGASIQIRTKKCLQKATKIVRKWCQQQAKQNKEKANHRARQLGALKIQLEQQPQNYDIQLQIQELLAKIEEEELAKARIMQIWMQGEWLKDGDKCTKRYMSLFKSRRDSNALHALFDQHRNIVTTLPEMHRVARVHFQKALSVNPEPTQQEADNVARKQRWLLDSVTSTLPQEIRDAIDRPITEEEVRKTIKQMPKNKTPGPDGIPAEFFQIFADLTIPLLTELFQFCWDNGEFPSYMLLGDICLIPKEGDHRDLMDKRPLTMLNVLIKIFTKLWQVRLQKALAVLISWNQTAFMRGRSIHHTVMMCNEALYYVKKTGDPTVQLQIDFKKAYDRVRWDFMLLLFEKLAFPVSFRRMFLALCRGATSQVIINGTRGEPFPITRSVRQGDPLSPSVFVLLMETLTSCSHLAQQQGLVNGIELPYLNMKYLNGSFADDTHLLLQADIPNLRNAKLLLDDFGDATGLVIQWRKSEARWIADTARPPETDDLGWKWKEDHEIGKLLGFPFAGGLNPQVHLDFLKLKITEKLQFYATFPLSLTGRVIVANHLLASRLWYTLTLNSTEGKLINEVQKILTNFVWGGAQHTARCRVQLDLICLPKSEGGLGLISIPAQAHSLCFRIFLWALRPGDHPLQLWVKGHLGNITNRIFGLSDLSCLLAPKKLCDNSMSPVIANMLKAWNIFKPYMSCPLPEQHEFHRLPIWGDPRVTCHSQPLDAKSALARNFRALGVHRVAQLWDSTAFTWKQIQVFWPNASPRVARAYTNLLSSLVPPTLYRETVPTFVLVCPRARPPFVCKLSSAGTVQQSFEVLPGDALLPHQENCQMDGPAARIQVREHKPRGSAKKQPTFFIYAGHHYQEAVLANFRWTGGKQLHAVSTKELRRMLGVDKTRALDRINNWHGLQFHAFDAGRWRRVWNPGAVIKQSSLQWQILYRANATNAWRFPQASSLDRNTWCLVCDDRRKETNRHLFWECPFAAVIWSWVITIFVERTFTTQVWEPGITHSVLGDKLPHLLSKFPLPYGPLPHTKRAQFHSPGAA